MVVSQRHRMQALDKWDQLLTGLEPRAQANNCTNLAVMLQGEVSILAHSLGSVLCYDILSCQPHLYAAVKDKQRSPGADSNSAGRAAWPGAVDENLHLLDGHQVCPSLHDR